ncbi:MAG: hypothetical protein AB9M53_00455 [Leptothrix sp. (in: b-proteobacteria)]
MRIPSAITAGDSATWVDYAFADDLGASVSSSGYTLGYSLRGANPAAAVDLVGTAAGTGWTFVLTSAQSGALNMGAVNATWYWSAFASKAGTRLTAGRGTLLVRPNLAAINVAFDGRSAAEQILTAVEAEIAGRVNGGATIEYTIGTRSLKKEPMQALLELRSQYRLIVSRERRAQQLANGLGNPQRLGVRFAK